MKKIMNTTDLRDLSKEKTVKDFIVLDNQETILVKKPDGGNLKIVEQYCGEYSLWYIVMFDKNNEEIRRYNLKYVTEFEWDVF